LNYVTIKNTSIKVSRLAYGTASLHHVFYKNKRIDILNEAINLGISHFDTSPYYGYGLSEIDLGRVINKCRDNVSIATKVGIYPPKGSSTNHTNLWLRKSIGRVFRSVSSPEINWTTKRANLSLESSLKRLKTDYVDFLFLHEPDYFAINSDEFIRWADLMVTQGKVRNMGIAGESENIIPWIHDKSILSSVVQTRDGIKDELNIDLMLKNNIVPQFTYGYLSSGGNQNIKNTMKNAFKRNSHGSVIVSTRKKTRLSELTSML